MLEEEFGHENISGMTFINILSWSVASFFIDFKSIHCMQVEFVVGSYNVPSIMDKSS